MTNFADLIEDYVDKKIKSKVEKDSVKKLLLIDLREHIEEESVCYDISVESLKVRSEYRRGISDAFHELLKKTMNSKDQTKKRLLCFSEYLKEKWKVDLELAEAFKREAINPYERLVDLLKTPNGGMTRNELMEYYSISKKPLQDDIDKLVKGTKILGQNVKIRDIKREHKKITYESSIHPIFLPLNLTEVYYLTVGLKMLSNEQKTIMSKTFDNLANRVYCQLSDYARNKIDKKSMTIGVGFPNEEEFDRYKGSRDEEEMARESLKSTFAYIWKAGIQCTIHMKNEDMEVIPDTYVHYDMDSMEMFLKDSLRGERKRKINIDEVLDIKFSYK